MRTDTWEAKPGVMVTMRPAIGADDIDGGAIAHAITRQLYPGIPIDVVPDRAFSRFLEFAKIIMQVVTLEGDLGIKMPTVYATDDEIGAFYRWLATEPENAELMSNWRSRIFALNRPPAQGLHTDVKNPESSGGVEKQSETSEGQPTAASRKQPAIKAPAGE